MNRTHCSAIGISVVYVSAAALSALLACSSSSTPVPEEPVAPKGAASPAPTSGNGSPGSTGVNAPSPTAPDAGNNRRQLRIFPRGVDTFYSGFDGTHTFTVPIGASAPGATTTIVWSVSDPTIASFSPDAFANDQSAGQPDRTVSNIILKTLKAGTVTVTATANGASSSTKLSVTAYTAEQFALGQQLYAVGSGGTPACLACHFLDGGVDHSPWYTAEWPDDGILRIVTTGTRPDGSKLRTPSHSWTVTDAQKPGIVAYLRQLPIEATVDP